MHLPVGRQQPHHVRLELGVGGAGVIDVRCRDRGFLQQRVLEDCPQAPMPFWSLTHQWDLPPVPAGVNRLTAPATS